MELIILDEEFKSLYNIDMFESIIWTLRYNGCGDFEFYSPVNNTILEIIKTIQKKMEKGIDCYAWCSDDDSAMIIENLEITTDAESGNHVIISGRGLESLLERRIIWQKTNVDGALQDGVKKLITEAIINPEISERRIPRFRFIESDDSVIKGYSLKAQYTGKNLYETIYQICEEKDLGFNVTLSHDGYLDFTLTRGKDRSYDQNTNPYVIFSPNYDNIVNSDYLESIKTLKNVTVVAGEGEGLARSRVVIGNSSGFSRRELYTDARDIQSENYSDQLEEDRRLLDEYRQKLENEINDLVNTNKDYDSKKKEHDDIMYIYAFKKDSFNMRMNAFQGAITVKRDQMNAYANNLPASLKPTLNLRNAWKEQSNNYQSLINDCDAVIDFYNNKLRNDEYITTNDILSCESQIKSQEQTKKSYEESKRVADENVSTTEETLPAFEDGYRYPENKIDEYNSIRNDDMQSLADVMLQEYDESSSWAQIETDHNVAVSNHVVNISNYQQKVSEYEQKVENDTTQLNNTMTAKLTQRGNEKLAENIYTKVFTGETETKKMFVYGKDFFMGDTVQIINEYGMETKVRVSELVKTQDTNGYSVYPTLQAIEKKGASV